MAESIDFSAPQRRSLRMRALQRVRRGDTPVERYQRAHLNWHLNPTPGTATERLNALLAVPRAREESR
jgi:hypothetical protein